MEIIEPEMRQATATCTTPACENVDLPITIPISWPDYAVICGGCNNAITDIQVKESEVAP